MVAAKGCVSIPPEREEQKIIEMLIAAAGPSAYPGGTRCGYCSKSRNPVYLYGGDRIGASFFKAEFC